MKDNEMQRRLSQLNDMKREVDELSQRIAKLQQEAQGGRVRGMPCSDRYDAALAEAIGRMAARRTDCMEELGRLYAFIDDLPDSRLRRIFSFRYIDGLTWQQVAFRIGEFDEQYPRKIHNRYLCAKRT